MNVIWRIIRKLTSLVYPPLKFSRLSFSQEGEDLLLLSFFEDLPADYKGFYVDIGAHHPFRFSNTFAFYERGWRGINIDALPESMTPFKKHRAQDINLEIAVGSAENPLTFYCFNEPALNTLDKALADSRDGKSGYRITGTVEVQVLSLEKILDTHLPQNQKIDFLTVDAEGFDFDILNSNSWKKYKPTFILVETLYSEGDRNPVHGLLLREGYEIVGGTMRTSVFKLIAQ
jgi:FkbM family methyltransferase